MKKLLIFFLFMGFTIFPSCASSTNDSAKLKAMALQETTLIVDVRSPEEFVEGHIENSINIPLEVVDDSLKLYEKYSNVILVCRSGNRSGMAMGLLMERGLEHIHNGGGWDSLNALLKKGNK